MRKLFVFVVVAFAFAIGASSVATAESPTKKAAVAAERCFIVTTHSNGRTTSSGGWLPRSAAERFIRSDYLSKAGGRTYSLDCG